MSYLIDGYHGEIVASAPPSARVAFIRRTYAHLAGAVLAFVGIEALLLTSGLGMDLVRTLFMGGGKGAWIGLMVLFVVGGIGAQMMARSRQSVGMQYAGLTLYVLLEVIIFLPILIVATQAPQYAGKDLPLQAGIVTLAAFGGLTVAVFTSGKDFSFLGPILWVGALLGTGLVIAAVIGGVSLGLGFAALMVALACGFIIYDTSNIMHHYSTDQHVSAALQLFASVALLFWYVLRIFMSVSNDD
ncbi:Inhibitor of apoptosis-promoting Bax1 [Gemmata sp. SH-PL17]|uniref:Bax inhibitor-1/YccA family protein n=1 Tax=Gemmata sp. SH-PL17 TaxID=1630693 RepID=UPI00078E371E|nr:Bax inhibitor-1 family protein [Gemmata sp. SH-PL17]AMV23695.1 Inhibitor of apoptosis-promoting Bax1 [Gemmata sp. SH-PL17]